MELHILLPSWLSAQTGTLKSYKDLQEAIKGGGEEEERDFKSLLSSLTFLSYPKNSTFKIAMENPENTCLKKKTPGYCQTWFFNRNKL